MTAYNIICETCDAEYSVYADEVESRLPSKCSFCGSDVPEDNITSNESDEWSDEDWDKLTDEALDDDEWKWDDKN